MQNKGMIICSFIKHGIVTNVGGIKNKEVNIHGLDGSIMLLPGEECLLESKDEDNEMD